VAAGEQREREGKKETAPGYYSLTETLSSTLSNT